MFAELLSAHAARHGDRSALTLLDHQGAILTDVSWSAIEARVAGIARFLADRSEPVALIHHDPASFIFCQLACLVSGVTAVPLPPLDPSRAEAQVAFLRRVLQDTGATSILACGASYAQLVDLLPEFAEGLVDCDELGTGTGLPNAPTWPNPAGLLYTSGSTSLPKGVPLRAEHLAYNGKSCCEAWSIDATSVLVSWMPNHHSFGLVYNVMLPLFSGCRLVIMRPSDFVASPALWLAAISRFGATHGAAATFGYQMCVDRIGDEELAGLDLSSWKVGLISAEPIRRAVCDRFLARFGAAGLPAHFFCPLYGLSESGPITSAQPGASLAWFGEEGAPRELDLARVGAPLPGTTLRVVDPVSLRLLDEGQTGEVWVSGPSVIEGYWRRDAFDATAFASLPDHAGRFFRTGDLGFFQDGHLFIRGRLKEILILRGKNHDPGDIELLARGAVPGAGLAVAFSEELPDGARAGVVVEVTDVAADSASRVASAVFKGLGVDLHRVVFVALGEIPTTASGKVRRIPCRIALSEGSLVPLADVRLDAVSEEQVLDAVIAVFAETLYLPADELDGSEFLADFGLASATLVVILERLERRLGLKAHPSLFFKCESLADLADQLVPGAR